MARGDGAGLQRTVAPAAGAGAASLRSAPRPPLRRFQTRPRKDSDKDSDGGLGQKRLAVPHPLCAAPPEPTRPPPCPLAQPLL